MVLTVSDIFSFLVSFSTGALMTLLWTRNSCKVYGIANAKIRQTAALLSYGNEPLKMTIVVRKDLRMGTGKIAAQCAHAAVKIVEDIHAYRCADSAATAKPMEREANSEGENTDGKEIHYLWISWYDAWTFTGSTKVALQCEGEEQLLAALYMARREKVPHALIRDAGRTQIAPGSRTVLAVGPAPCVLVDRITGHFKLL